MQQYQLKSKAYQLDLNKIEDGYSASERVCHADSFNKARSVLFKEIQYEDWKCRFYGTDITYLNIPVKRWKDGDKYEFEGEDVPLWKIQEILAERERTSALDGILNDDSIIYCYIGKRGGYYRPNSGGYTEMRIRAGVYTKEEAVSSAKSCNEVDAVPINIEEHNQLLTQEINELKTRLIQ